MTIFHIPADEVELTAIRSQGPGGQNVNKVASAIQLRFDIRASSLPMALKERLLVMSDHRITQSGVVVIKSQEHRSQDMNRMAALLRLHDLLEMAAVVPKKRKATRPTRSSQVKRVESKAPRHPCHRRAAHAGGACF
ncbi:MAG: aminoacyl-tRNA hydrolase [Betaproteobacteria bacterium]|nr:aminoacyl-tRNA hydrolase [Betaproteobacteria bacterium]